MPRDKNPINRASDKELLEHIDTFLYDDVFSDLRFGAGACHDLLDLRAAVREYLEGSQHWHNAVMDDLSYEKQRKRADAVDPIRTRLEELVKE